MAKSDKEFALMAVSLKYITQEQAEEGLRLLAKARQVGLTETLAEVLVKKGLINRAQEAAIVRALNQPRLSHIGKYRLIARVGQGGMGTVYKARQESLDKIVALKVLAPALARQKDFVDRFIREAQASGRLNHRNIVLGFDAGEADGYYYFAMEFVDGENLKDVLERDGKLPERRALEIAASVAAALEHAQQQNIVHRDIKPGNIFIGKDGTPKLGDLGLAKEIRTDQSITQAGIPVGTPYYISPEQVRGQQDIDQRADLYAVGATLYRMVAGEVPYDGPTGAVVMTRHLNDPIPDPRRNTPGLSEACVAVIHRCMEKDRGDRYQNATQLREDVEAALAGQPLPHASKQPPRAAARARLAAAREAQAAAKKRRLVIAGSLGGGIVTIVLVIVGISALGGKGRPPQPPPTPRPATAHAVPRPRPPKTSVRPKPPTTPTPAVVQKPKAGDVFQEIQALAADSEDRAAIEKRLRDFILDYAGAPEVTQAKALLADLKARWKARDDFKAAIAEQIRQHRFAEAKAALDAPPFKDDSPKTKAMLDDLAGQVRRAASEFLASQTTKGEELIQQGDLAGAKELYEGLAKLGLPEAAEASRAALNKIEALAQARMQRLVQSALAALIVKAGPSVKAGKIADAREVFDPAQAGGNAILADLLKSAQGDIDRLGTLFADVERELSERAASGQRARVKGITRPINKVEGGILQCVGGNFGIHELTTIDLNDLNCTKDKKALIGLLELYRGDAPSAKAEFQKHGASPQDPDVARWLHEADWVEDIAKEGEAAQALASARDLADQGKWKDASALIAKLGQQYAETAFVEKNRAAIHQLGAKCAEAVAAAIRKAQTIRPFIDVSEKCGDFAQAIKTFKPVGGWVMDIDNDGMLDIALDIRRAAGASPYVPIFRNETKRGDANVAFRDITKEAALDTGDEPICWADLDSDGDLDVACRGLWSGSGANRTSDHKKLAIYENTGKPAALFKLDPARALVPELAQAPGQGGYGFGNIAVLDVNGDGRADILAQFVGQLRTLCLFAEKRGKATTFADVTQEVGFLIPKGKQFEVPAFLQSDAWPQYVVFDCDGDGRADLIYNAATGVLLRNAGRRGFVPIASSLFTYETYVTNNSPTIIPAVADYDNDGKIDIFVPQKGKGKNLLLRNTGDGRFVDALPTTGPMATDENNSLWATWADVNNDGLLDLFICNEKGRNRLYIQMPNHAFMDKAPEYGLTGEMGEKTNFAAFADFDRDGDLDMLILRDNGRSQLLLNPTIEADNHFSLAVLVRAKVGAIGAKVYLIRPPDQIIGLQQVCRVEGYNRQTPREAFFGVPAPGKYGVKVVLSNDTELKRLVEVNPSIYNEAVFPEKSER